MRIVFVCGSLESGRDGVGDYTRLLASELIRAGTPCRMLALNDRFVSTTLEQIQSCGGAEVETLRLGAGVSLAERTDFAKRWVDDFSPDLISLQYVHYAFHPKGLPRRIASQILDIAGSRRVHIMFHETWIGFSRVHPLKHRIYGFFQRQLAVGLVRRLKPFPIHTSNRLYQLLLAENDITSDILPIFSNIPVVDWEPVWMWERLAEMGIHAEERDSWMVLGIFGSIHSDFSPAEPLRRAVADARSRGLKVALVVIGRAGSGLQSLESMVKDDFPEEVAFGFFGEQTADRVSQFCKSIDYAIATMPSEFMAKSGTIAAFLAHGVPILESHSVFFPEYDGKLRESAHRLIQGSAAERTVYEVSRGFLKSVVGV